MRTRIALLCGIFLFGVAGCKKDRPVEKADKAMQIPQGLPGGPPGEPKDPLKKEKLAGP
jgi:hypothetical protein